MASIVPTLLGSLALICLAVAFTWLLESGRSRCAPDPTSPDRGQFYRTSEFWGAFGTFATFVITAISFGVSGHSTLAKWFLVVACPFAAITCWLAFANIKSVRPYFTIGATLLVAALLYRIYWMMNGGQASEPAKGAKASITQPVAPPPQIPPERRDEKSFVKPPASQTVKTPSPQTPELPQPKPIPTIRSLALKFVIKKNLSFEIVNAESQPVMNPRYSLQMTNLDNERNKDPDQYGLIMLPTTTEMLNDYVPPKAALGPISVGNRWEERGLLKAGDRMFGMASIGCPTCSEIRYYYVYAVHGHDGWYCESAKPISVAEVAKIVVATERGTDDPANYCPEAIRLPIDDILAP